MPNAYGGFTPPAYRGDRESTMAQRYTRKDRLRQEVIELERRLAKLESRPEEPEFEDDFPHVVWFQRDFGRGSRKYTYAAVRAAGFWYVSGRVESMQRRTWDQLMDWIFSSFDSGVSDYEPELWVAVEWSEL